MRVDFYQLAHDPAETALCAIAERSLAIGERLLIVSADKAQRARISKALWAHKPECFLAHGDAGSSDDARQPILIAAVPEAANGARFLALADGQWREGAGFARIFLLFDDASIAAARRSWRELGTRAGVERRFWVQQGRGWRERS